MDSAKEARVHILEGLITVLENIDSVVELISNSETDEAMKKGLVERFGLSDNQIQVVLDMRLELIKKSELLKVKEEYAKLTA